MQPNAPNFFVLGAAKCGTTALHALLSRHPQIFMSKQKEPHFFDADTYFRKGTAVYLRDHFRKANRYPIRGEATPQYFHMGESVAPRMQACLGSDLKFLVILRDPVQRAWSHYLHLVRFGVEDCSFEEALEVESERETARRRWKGYFADGLYARQLETWFKWYPRERFIVVLTEELLDDQDSLIKRVFGFLDVDSSAPVTKVGRENVAARPKIRWLARVLHKPTGLNQKLKLIMPYRARLRLRHRIDMWNRSPYVEQPRMDSGTRATLVARYAADVRRLQTILERDLTHWLQP